MPDAGDARGAARRVLLDTLLVIAIAAFLIWPLFRIEYLTWWDSIDATFIADARFLVEHWPHPEWQPNWYAGTRFDYIYPPGLRYGTAALSLLLGVSTARAYHLFTAILYVLGIGAMYLLVRLGSGSRLWGWIVGVATAIFSPSFLFLENFREGYSLVRYMPVRLGVLVRWGEGPHSSAFALLPLALAAAWFGLRRRQPIPLALSALASTLVVLTNFYGANALAIFFPVLVWAVWLAERDHFVWLRAAAITALSYGLASFWLTPSYLRITLRNMQLVSNPGTAWSLWLAIAVACAFAAVSWKLAWGKPERAWAVFVFGGLTLMSLNVLGQHFFNFRVIGEPERLIPEFDMIFLMASGVLLSLLWNRNLISKAAVVLVLLAALYPSKGWIRRSWEFFPVDPNPTQRLEYRLTQWMHEHLPDVRAMATGSIRFWYNGWFTLPQLGGGSEQGLINLTANIGYMQIVGGNPAEVSIRWARSLGVGALIVHDARSAEIYHDYVKPERFQPLLKTLYEDGAGNWVYEVPRRYAGRARVVDAAGVRALGFAAPEMNWDHHARYVSLIEEGPASPVATRRLGTGAISLRARMQPGEALLVQENYDPAWRAYSSGKPVPVEAEFMGFMLLDPGPGDHEILLRFETPLENKIGRMLTLLAALIFAGLIARGLRRRRTA